MRVRERLSAADKYEPRLNAIRLDRSEIVFLRMLIFVANRVEATNSVEIVKTWYSVYCHLVLSHWSGFLNSSSSIKPRVVF